jgi:patatin-like phospholipase/acyl hydrolase
MKKKVCVLSIDGGGIRQIIPSVILKYIEDVLKKENPNARLSDYFDFFVGADMGGILTSLLVIPDANGRSKIDAKAALEFFTNNGEAIFDVSIWKRLKSMGGMTDEKYSSKKLEGLLNDLMGDNRLGDVVKPLMLSAYDVRNREAKLYSFTDAQNPIRNFYLRDLCRASAAIPSYFEPARIKSETETPFTLVSGSLFASNPTMMAYAETRKMNFATILEDDDKPVFPMAQDLFVVSLGAGEVKKPYYFDTVKDWGEMSWLKPIMDMLTSSNSETVDYQMRQLFSTVTPTNDYIRLNPKLKGVATEIDDASADNIRNLVDFSENFIKENKADLDLIVDKLIAYNRVD